MTFKPKRLKCYKLSVITAEAVFNYIVLLEGFVCGFLLVYVGFYQGSRWGVFLQFYLGFLEVFFMSQNPGKKKKKSRTKQAHGLYLCPFLSVEVNVCIILSLILIIIT